MRASEPGWGSPDAWNCGLLDYVAWRSHHALAKRGITVLSDLNDKTPEELDKWADSYGKILVIAAFDLWESDTRASAKLASTDGAVLFDQRLCAAAFGCKFVTQEPDQNEHRELRAFIEKRGLRHHSAAGYVASSPASSAIVVSQDGPATAFVHRNGTVEPVPIRI
jgi:hypothetical protein